MQAGAFIAITNDSLVNKSMTRQVAAGRISCGRNRALRKSNRRELPGVIAEECPKVAKYLCSAPRSTEAVWNKDDNDCHCVEEIKSETDRWVLVSERDATTSSSVSVSATFETRGVSSGDSGPHELPETQCRRSDCQMHSSLCLVQLRQVRCVSSHFFFRLRP